MPNVYQQAVRNNIIYQKAGERQRKTPLPLAEFEKGKSMERYQRIATRLLLTGRFRAISNCGAPTKYNPINLLCVALDDIRIYIGQGFCSKPTYWSLDYTYDPECQIRADMRQILEIRTEREMLELVGRILDGEFKGPKPTIREEIQRLTKIVDEQLGIAEEDDTGCSITCLANELKFNIAEVLRISPDPDKTLAEFQKLFYESEFADKLPKYVNLAEAERDAEIRPDWDLALKTVPETTDLSRGVGWALSKQDFAELAKLHRDGKHRAKIEDLLEDCNFHIQRGELHDGNYQIFFSDC